MKSNGGAKISESSLTMEITLWGEDKENEFMILRHMPRTELLTYNENNEVNKKEILNFEYLFNDKNLNLLGSGFMKIDERSFT